MEAIKLANDFKFGLGANIWTIDLDEQIVCQKCFGLEE
jgi:acyl-CoA reductase-like NAD-dependent aldehyde dehydrogenase